MNIAGREIGPGHPPYIIAEISCNHGGSLSRATELIQRAKWAGADAVKFQAMTADTITIDCDRPEFTIKDGPWAGRKLYELYLRAETPFAWFPTLKEFADDIGITWFASVFDKRGVDFMVKMVAPAIKIASFELVDTPLIKYAVETGKPMILSTGMATYQEIWDAVPKDMDRNNLALLHCVSGYPTPASEANLTRINALKRMFRTDHVVGLSDHSIGPEIPIAAIALGADIIEKHFRLSHHPATEDAPFSLNEEQFVAMVQSVQRTWQAIQSGPSSSEESSRPIRRSLFAVENIKAGDLFRADDDLVTKANIRSIRPGHGAPPAAIDQFIGKHAARDIERGEPMTFDMISADDQWIIRL